MKSRNQPLTLLLITIITLSIALPYVQPKTTTTTTTNDLVQTTCKRTVDPSLCETALRLDPRSSKANTQGLILIMIDTVKSRFSNSLRYVQGLGKRSRDPGTIRAFKKCAEVYQLVVNSNVGVAVNAVKQGDPKFGEQAMVDAGNEAEACRSAFPDGHGPAQVAGRTRVLHGVSNVAASMIKILE